MLTVPDAARRLRRNPETVRRWIREGRLRSIRVGTQYLIDEADLDEIRADATLRAPRGWWAKSHTEEPLPDFMAVLRRQRTEH